MPTCVQSSKSRFCSIQMSEKSRKAKTALFSFSHVSINAGYSSFKNLWKASDCSSLSEIKSCHESLNNSGEDFQLKQSCLEVTVLLIKSNINIGLCRHQRTTYSKFIYLYIEPSKQHSTDMMANSINSMKIYKRVRRKITLIYYISTYVK